MGKRKRIHGEEDLEKELRRLRRKIDKLANYKYSDVEKNGTPVANPKSITSRPVSPEPDSPENRPPEIVSPELIVEEAAEPETVQETVQETEDVIDSDILAAMGLVEEESISGPPVHTEIAQRWTPVLTKGLKKEEKALLNKQYIPFNNIPTMIPPKLNPEVAAAITEPVKKRDNLIENRQKQIATALTAIGCGLQCFLTKGNKVEGVKNFNDAAKIMCDIFHWESGSRRILIQNVVNKDMKETLQDEPDTFLFGKALSEKIKATKAVQKSAQDLAKSQYNNTSKANKTNKSLNWRASPQQSYRTNYQQGYKNQQHSGGGKKTY